VSADKQKLSLAKNRDIKQPFLISVDSNKKLLNLTRVPNKHKKVIRRSEKSSFLYKNKKAIRVVKNSPHVKFLNKFNYLLSTSANKNKENYDYTYAFKYIDILVEDKRGLLQLSGSKISKLGKTKISKLR
jgi:tRNA A37 threonylcarbamoyladenosine synthetase subunit TsaC/SUA5/YrdC